MPRKPRGYHAPHYRNRRSGSLYFTGWKANEQRRENRQAIAKVIRTEVVDADGNVTEIIEVVRVFPHRPYAQQGHVEQVACATPESRVDLDHVRERMYTWRGMANKQALKLALRIKDDIPSKLFFTGVQNDASEEEIQRQLAGEEPVRRAKQPRKHSDKPWMRRKPRWVDVPMFDLHPVTGETRLHG
jgi:hypothetical protein